MSSLEWLNALRRGDRVAVTPDGAHGVVTTATARQLVVDQTDTPLDHTTGDHADE
ncbi:hypothetical protein MARPU_09615 [Marichromatium purpuratum 984]|uniref:Uncharacterized protein n=1 Tax=Marichromatium purpuratum 984 TaxID=765910 RepID=W0E8W2_MARPU|nr:hypothetical protein [Marichromatium purpuratum]AHF05516.1 hypothetical protein MARPU_09615 [Marichromatium purpuratum 984]